MLENISFYLPQILIGTVVGIFTSIIGIFIILRKTIFMGITLSQSITVAVILSLLFNIHYEGVVHLLAIIMFLPIYIAHNNIENKDALLAAGFVFFAALGQILTTIGANVQNHIVTAYFGNILLINEKEWFHIIIPLIITFILLFVFYKWLMAISFDKEYAIISNLPVILIETIYFIILTAILSLSIYFMGSFYSIAHLIIPGFIALQIARNMKIAFLIAILISMISTCIGFVISLIEISVEDQILHLPTSSTIIIMLCLCFIILLYKKFTK